MITINISCFDANLTRYIIKQYGINIIILLGNVTVSFV